LPKVVGFWLRFVHPGPAQLDQKPVPGLDSNPGSFVERDFWPTPDFSVSFFCAWLCLDISRLVSVSLSFLGLIFTVKVIENQMSIGPVLGFLVLLVALCFGVAASRLIWLAFLRIGSRGFAGVTLPLVKVRGYLVSISA